MKVITPNKEEVTCHLNQPSSCVNMSVANPDNIQAMRHHLIPHLPTDTDPEAVALFPRSASTQSTTMEIDVFINPYAAELLRTNKVSTTDINLHEPQSLPVILHHHRCSRFQSSSYSHMIHID
jgi:hypothetical protein